MSGLWLWVRLYHAPPSASPVRARFQLPSGATIIPGSRGGGGSFTCPIKEAPIGDVFRSAEFRRVRGDHRVESAKGHGPGAADAAGGVAERMVRAFNVTDSAGANMTMAPIAAAHLMIDRGIEPILQVTGRDRNRIALEGEILAAAALGVRNVLCMSGDPPGRGDHPDAKGVFDLKAETLLEAVTAMNSGKDMYGNELKGTPTLFAGAVANPGADDVDTELARMEDKVRCGASFFQTQAVYDAASFEKFMEDARGFGVPVLAGMIVLKSGGMARFLNDKLPGVSVPQTIVDEMDGAEDRAAAGVRITARLIDEVRGCATGRTSWR